MNKIISIIPSLKKRKLLGFSFKSYTLIVFEKETILARLTSAIQNENIAKAKEQAKADGKGFFGKMGAQMSASLNYSKRYESMSFDQIKDETEGNLVFTNDSITKVRTRIDEQIEQGRTYYYVTLVASGEKYRFTTEQDPRSGLKKAFGSKSK